MAKIELGRVKISLSNCGCARNCGSPRRQYVRKPGQLLECVSRIPQLRPKQMQVFAEPAEIVRFRLLAFGATYFFEHRTQSRGHGLPASRKKTRGVYAWIPGQAARDFLRILAQCSEIGSRLLLLLRDSRGLDIGHFHMRILRHSSP